MEPAEERTHINGGSAKASALPLISPPIIVVATGVLIHTDGCANQEVPAPVCCAVQAAVRLYCLASFAIRGLEAFHKDCSATETLI